jgi:DNA-binding CsgD family transcriptional regulator
LGSTRFRLPDADLTGSVFRGMLARVVGRKVPLLERDAELEELHAALEDARRGNGRLVVVEGAAGIGKTRLLAAARETAGRTGVRALAARGSELERDFPFALVRQLFEPVLHAASEDESAELLDGAARLAGRVVGVESEASGAGSSMALDPGFATLNALYWLTSNVAESRPLLLAVDDAHWADRPSLRFFRFLLSRLEDLPVLLVLAARRSEVGAEVELLAQLTADSVARVVRPQVLSRAAVGELVRAALSTDADDEFCAACYQASGGNPFMVHELLVELAAEGSAGTKAEAGNVSQLAPATISRTILMRLARLPDTAGRLARAVAVMGDAAPLRLAAALAGVDRNGAAQDADALARAGILEPGRPLSFTHPLVRNAIYGDLAPAERARHHRRAARLLSGENAGSDEIAIHLLATEANADPGVVEALLEAARLATAKAAPEVALTYMLRALAEPPTPTARPEILVELVRCGISLGPATFARLDVDPVEELARNPHTLTNSAAELTTWLLAYGRVKEATELLQRAIGAAIEASEHDLAIRLEAQLLSLGQLPVSKARARFERYESQIKPGTPGERLWLALQAVWSGFGGGAAVESAELARRALDGGEIFSETWGMEVLPGQAIMVLLAADELEPAERAIEHLSYHARATGSANLHASTNGFRSHLAHLRGNIVSAEAYGRSSVDLAREHGILLAVPILIGYLLDALIERDELDAADEELTASGITGEIPDTPWLNPLLHNRASVRLAQGRTRDGLEDLLELERRRARPLLGTPWSAALALALVGEQANARDMAQRDLERGRVWGTPRAIGVALRVLGIIEGGERGIERLAEAVQVLAASPARLEDARALTDYGAALRRANRRAEAREPLRSALEMAREFGALAIAKRAHHELEATGEKLRPLLAGGVESLTPSERRVAEMAAGGSSNREIAQSLFLTVKTVETHLSHAYRKLDITSRGELANVLSAT